MSEIGLVGLSEDGRAGGGSSSTVVETGFRLSVESDLIEPNSAKRRIQGRRHEHLWNKIPGIAFNLGVAMPVLSFLGVCHSRGELG